MSSWAGRTMADAPGRSRSPTRWARPRAIATGLCCAVQTVRNAIRAFQKNAGVRETGDPSKELYAAMRAALANRDVVTNSPLPLPPKAEEKVPAAAAETKAEPPAITIDIGRPEPPPPPPTSADIVRPALPADATWPPAPADQIKAVQTLLFELNLLRDTPDGVIGPMTRTAIRDYEKTAGLKITGEQLSECLSQQVATVLGAPAATATYPTTVFPNDAAKKYTCRDMKTSHAGQGIADAIYTKFLTNAVTVVKTNVPDPLGSDIVSKLAPVLTGSVKTDIVDNKVCTTDADCTASANHATMSCVADTAPATTKSCQQLAPK